MLAARLRRLGVPTIVVEKNARAGDSWRNRYKTLCLHDPVWYDHLPYLPFPDDWPGKLSIYSCINLDASPTLCLIKCYKLAMPSDNSSQSQSLILVLRGVGASRLTRNGCSQHFIQPCFLPLNGSIAMCAVFSPKDKLGDWLEMYTKVMEINYWTSTTAQQASFDEATGRWTYAFFSYPLQLCLLEADLLTSPGTVNAPVSAHLHKPC